MGVFSDASSDSAVQARLITPRPKLSPALWKLLREFARAGNVDSKTLASRLFCSEQTVRTYFKRINRELGTRSRAEILFMVLHNGWLTDENEPTASNLTGED